MQEYQSNSHRSKELQAEKPAKREIRKVVDGAVKTKKNNGRKLLNTFISEDAGNVKEYLWSDVVVPAICNMIIDAGTNAINMIFGGRGGGRKSYSTGAPKVSYRNYYDNPRSGGTGRYSGRDSERALGVRFDYDDILFTTRGQAQVVADYMLECFETYGVVSVADMYDMAGLTVMNPQAHKYGWMGLRNIEVKRVSGGYILDLPKFMQID